MQKKMPKKKKQAAPKTAAARAPEIVGRVTPQERDEIQALYERKNGLNELVLSLQDSELLNNPHFYEKIVADLGRTTTRSADWWNEKAKLYGWKNAPGGHWTIDFDSCDILLTTPLFH